MYCEETYHSKQEHSVYLFYVVGEVLILVYEVPGKFLGYKKLHSGRLDKLWKLQAEIKLVLYKKRNKLLFYHKRVHFYLWRIAKCIR